jgi:RNA polymerase sigma-70 factor (ECF subfamily)
MNKKLTNKLANQIRKGNLIAYNQIFNFFYKPLVFFVQTFVLDFEISRDIVQECFIKLWEKRLKLPFFTNFESYIYKSAKSNTIDYIRKKTPTISLTDITSINHITKQDKIETQELKQIIYSTIEEAPEKMQRIFRLFKFEDKKQYEIADIMGISVKTVEWNIAQLKSNLKNNIKKYYSN